MLSHQGNQTALSTIKIRIMITILGVLLAAFAINLVIPASVQAQISESAVIEMAISTSSVDYIRNNQQSSSLSRNWQDYQASLNWADYLSTDVPPQLPTDVRFRSEPF